MIESLHNKHKGEACAILLNGPSLSDYDLKRIDCTTIGVNRSWLLHDSDYHVCTDDSHWVQFARIEAQGDVTKLSPLITGEDGPEHAIKVKILEPSETGIGWSWDLAHGAYLCSSISIFALQVAVYMGFSTIYLLGLDLTDRDGESKFHGHPDAWQEYRGWRWEARQRELMGYAAGLLHCKVWISNLSPISKCLAFPKTTFEEVFINGRRKGRNRDPELQQVAEQDARRSHRARAQNDGSKKKAKGQGKGRGRGRAKKGRRGRSAQ